MQNFLQKAVVSIVLSCVSLILPAFAQAAPGDTVPDFSLPNIDGGYFSSRQTNGMVAVLFSHSCPWARSYEQRLFELSQKYHQSLPLILINSDDERADPNASMGRMQHWVQYRNFPAPYLKDSQQILARNLNVDTAPYAVILLRNGSGRLEVFWEGAIDDSPQNSAHVRNRFLDNAIQAALQGYRAQMYNAPVAGCRIKFPN